MRRDYLLMGKVLCCRLDLWSHAGDVLFWDREEPFAMGHFKDYEVVANCIVLLIVLCLWQGVLRQFVVAKAFPFPRGHFARG